MKSTTHTILKSREKVLIVIVDFKAHNGWPIEDTRKELEELVAACYGEVVDCLVCRVDKPTASYLIGSGKVNEIANLLTVKDFNTVVFSHDLKGSQQRNIEEVVKVKTIDRTQLILDIFARRAKSQEGKMQVELAQLEYLLPRLVGHGIELSRLGGGIGTMGPGETKLEIDRRRISERIHKLKSGLKEVEASRSINKKKRKENSTPSVCLVGYTNAGKSTVFNFLTKDTQVTQDALFTTLDSLSRQWTLPNHQRVVLSDTVGFIHQLPHHLVESFKATLEEVREADLLLHVLDVSQPQFQNLYKAVVEVLAQLGSSDKPSIVVLNKIDKLADKSWLKSLENDFENAVAISAQTGENVDRLFQKISAMLGSMVEEIEVIVPLNRMDLINLAHEKGQVYSVEYNHDGIRLKAALPTQFIGKFQDI